MSYVFGIGGGFDHVHEKNFRDWHDGAAVLLHQGRVVAAIEEERLNRIKHSNKLPAAAIRACLRQAGITAAAVERWALVNRLDTAFELTTQIQMTAQRASPVPFMHPDAYFQHQLHAALDETIPLERIVHVPHHEAHAVSAFAMSGYKDALIITLDGVGDRISGLVQKADGACMQTLRTLDLPHSLGKFYLTFSHYLGFKQFDEFKVMGLAPYGDPARFRPLFERMCTLLPDGDYQIDNRLLGEFIQAIRPRKKPEPIEQIHMDLAAALQESLERLAMHLIAHFQAVTGARSLCLAGGVAHNCTLNGKLMYSRLFDHIFVQPAAHDAGTALGAALAVHTAKPRTEPLILRDIFWGQPLAAAAEIEQQLQGWQGFLTATRPADIFAETARLLAAGKVFGWVQGRSEFGPRALGNRSIVADPRPAENRSIINAMVKKREAFRPFAPAVLEEDLHTYFEVPDGVADLSFMTYVVKVREEMRPLLGAVTHIDGTARVQTVSRAGNERFWLLIKAFKEITGVGVLLNTSFNNHAEPIVDCVDDAIACFLTTRLQHLVVGDHLASKAPEVAQSAYLSLRPRLNPVATLRRERYAVHGAWQTLHCVTRQQSENCTYGEDFKTPISPELYAVLDLADGAQSLAQLLRLCSIPAAQVAPLIDELLHLWDERLISVTMAPEPPLRHAAAPCV